MSEKQPNLPKLNLIANEARGSLKTDPNSKKRREQILKESRELRKNGTSPEMGETQDTTTEETLPKIEESKELTYPKGFQTILDCQIPTPDKRQKLIKYGSDKTINYLEFLKNKFKKEGNCYWSTLGCVQAEIAATKLMIAAGDTGQWVGLPVEEVSLEKIKTEGFIPKYFEVSEDRGTIYPTIELLCELQGYVTKVKTGTDSEEK